MASAPDRPPTISPTNGQAQAEAAVRSPSAPGTGSRVSSASARGTSRGSSNRVSGVGDIVGWAFLTQWQVGPVWLDISQSTAAGNGDLRVMTPTAPRTGAELAAVLHTAPGPDETSRAAAEARNGQLTKPPGALGRLEELAIWYCGWRGDATARIASPQVAVFAGNHGVTAQGVSAFPADVTAQMVANFNAGGAAINQLAEMAGARLDVVPIALDQPTADFTQGPAMDAAGFAEALAAGWNTVDPGPTFW
jgi:hypothetical protein